MGLQVWLPLNGNIDNQGLTPVTLSVGSPTYTSGKIGQCLNTTLAFNVSNNLITNLGSTNTYSMCCWCKDLNTSTGGRWVFSISSGTGTTRGLWENNSSTSRHWAYSGSGVNLSTSINTIDGNWHHICFTSAGSVVKLYVDGIYQSQVTSASITAMTANIITLNANDYNLNDFRLYDHVLSPREIKEISKGLVLHYPLSMPGQENLLLNTATPVSWTTTYTNTDQWSTKDIYNMKSPVNQLFVANDTATFSFDWVFTPGSSGSIKGSFHLETGNVTPWILGSVSKSTGTRNNASNYIDLSTTNKSGHVTCTFIVSSSAATAADTFRYFRIRWDKTPTDGTLTLSNCKLERGEIATPWIPNSADAAYSTLGFNDGIEYDVSGFQYNGEKYGDLKWSNNSAKYNSCYEFDGSSDYIRLKQDLYSQFRLARDEVTVNIWAYKDDWGDYKNSGSTAQWMTMCGCQERGGFSIYEVGNGRFAFICGTGESSNSYKGSNTATGYADSLSAGWHMFTLTFDGLSLKGYVDGNLVVSNAFFTTKTPIYYNTGTTSIYIGVESGSGNQAGLWWKGKLSDFRVYTTALSAEDVAELYNTPISLSNNGTLLGYEYVEV